MAFVEPEKLDNIPAVEWGKTHEVDDSEPFMQNEGTKHNLPRVHSCGLVRHKPHPNMGATPVAQRNVSSINVHTLSGEKT